jgi:predicted alpha/beta hydrolase family esterase
VGWSSGAVAAMRYAETHKLCGSVLVAPCSSDLGSELEKQSGYFDKPWDWNSIKANQQHIAIVHSDNDPFIPQEEFKIIESVLDPDIILIPDAKHFIESVTFPQVLEYFLHAYPK